MTSTPESSHSNGGRRKKLTTIVFDTDFFMRPRTRLLMRKHGVEAASIYMAVICWMAYEESSDIFSFDSVDLLAVDLEISPDKLKDVLLGCVGVGYLEMVEGGWRSERVATELGIVRTKQTNYTKGALEREAAKRAKVGFDSVAVNGLPVAIETAPKQTKAEQDSARLTKTKINPGRDIKTDQDRKEQEKEQEQDQEQDEEQEPESAAKQDSTDPTGPEVLPPDPNAVPPDPLVAKAEALLKPITDPAVCMSSMFHATGRRPMQKYPRIWITAPDLADALRQLTNAGIPFERLRELVFRPVESQLETDEGNGSDPSRSNAYLKITGWGRINALRVLREENDLERSENSKRRSQGAR